MISQSVALFNCSTRKFGKNQRRSLFNLPKTHFSADFGYAIRHTSSEKHCLNCKKKKTLNQVLYIPLKVDPEGYLYSPLDPKNDPFSHIPK